MNLLTFDEITEKVIEMASELDALIIDSDFDGCFYELEVCVKSKDCVRTLKADFCFLGVLIGDAQIDVEMFATLQITEADFQAMNIGYEKFRKEYSRLWLGIDRLNEDDLMREHLEGLREQDEERRAEMARYQ